MGSRVRAVQERLALPAPEAVALGRAGADSGAREARRTLPVAARGHLASVLAVRAIAIGFVVAAVAAGLAACGGSTPKTIVIPGGGTIKSNGTGNSYTVSTGGNTLSEGTSLPSDFPSAVPLPSGYRVLTNLNGVSAPGSGSNNGGAYFYLTLGVPGKPAAADAAYTAKLRSAGFTITSSGGAYGEEVVIAKSAKWGVSATFSAKFGGTGAGASSSGLRSGECALILSVATATPSD